MRLDCHVKLNFTGTKTREIHEEMISTKDSWTNL